MKSGQDLPQLTHVTFPKIHMTVNDYKALPSSVKCVVAVMHTNQHYAVIETTIDTNTIKVFDGLYQPLLDRKDHVSSAMRKCMLVDPLVVPSSTQFHTLRVSYSERGCPLWYSWLEDCF